MSVLLGTGIIEPALRIANVTLRPGRVSNTDKTTECIAIANRMLGTWNVNPLDIYSTSIDRYALTPGQTTYFIGPTGDFVAPRPVRLLGANIVLVGTSPEVHIEMRILTDAQWKQKTITEIPFSIPREIYNDGAQPDSKLYLWGFPTVANDLELFTPLALRRDFGAITDVVDLPDGYEDAIVYNLARRVCSYFKSQGAVMSADDIEIANKTLAAIESLNAPVPVMKNDAAGIGQRQGNGPGRWDWTFPK